VQQRVRVSKRSDVEQGLGATLRASHAGNVREFNGRRHPLAWVEQRGELIETIVGHPGHADVGVGLSAPGRGLSNAGEELEKRRLPGRRESNEACTQHKNESVYQPLHFRPPWLSQICTSLLWLKLNN